MVAQAKGQYQFLRYFNIEVSLDINPVADAHVGVEAVSRRCRCGVSRFL